MNYILAKLLSYKIKDKKKRKEYREDLCSISFSLFSPNKISGKNNKIIILNPNGKERKLRWYEKINGLKIIIKGENNIVKLARPFGGFSNCEIFIRGKNNVFQKEKSRFGSSDTKFHMSAKGDNRLMQIGEDFSIGSGLIWNEEDNTHLCIGNYVMCSINIHIRNSDSHVILDDKNNIINKSSNLSIGNHVWLGANSSILKGINIPNNTIVGYGSVVTKSFSEEYTIIAGNPARTIKQGVHWEKDKHNDYVKKHQL